VFGTLPDGRVVSTFTLKNTQGSSVTLCDYGASILRWDIAGGDSDPVNIVLGLDSVEAYIAQQACLGGAVGRGANRLDGGRLVIEGRRYQLEQNIGEHHLHGGSEGFHRCLWEIDDDASTDAQSVTLRLRSPAGAMGYPGSLNASLSFALDNSNTLSLDFQATSNKPTYLSFTHHSYFNLSGASDIRDHEIQIASDSVLAVASESIPTGELVDIRGRALDVRSPTVLRGRMDSGDEIIESTRGFDQCYVIDQTHLLPGGAIARLRDPRSGRWLEVFAPDSPGVQFYTGQNLNVLTDGYAPYAGLCLEPQDFPNAPNITQWNWKPLAAGEVYRRRISYRAGRDL
jgi:aldose 1-epimerase